MADALYDFSDHLPVVAEYSVSLSDISIDENLLTGISFNNPVSDLLRISGLDGDRNFSIQIRELSGRLLYHVIQEKPVSSTSIDLTFLPEGIYLVYIRDDLGRQLTQKIVKGAY